MQTDLEIKNRNYGIDLLRIITMFMIVNLHILYHGGILSSEKLYFGSTKFNIVWIIEIVSYVAVNCYALISGFVGVNSKNKYSNIILLWLRVAFYSILLYLLACKFGIIEYDYNTFITFCFPVLNSKYWYFTAYFVLFFFMPILNAGLQNLDYKQLRNTVILIIIVTCILPFIYAGDVFQFKKGYSFVWLLVLYIIGGFIGKYNLNIKFSKILMLLLFVLCVALEFGSLYLTNYMKLKGVEKFKYSLVSYMSPTMLLSGIALVILFSKMELRFLRKIISFLSPLCFSVYLIHEHKVIRNKYIAGQFERFLDYPTKEMVISIAITVISIFCIGIFIDFFRECLFKILRLKKLFSFIDKN